MDGLRRQRAVAEQPVYAELGEVELDWLVLAVLLGGLQSGVVQQIPELADLQLLVPDVTLLYLELAHTLLTEDAGVVPGRPRSVVGEHTGLTATSGTSSLPVLTDTSSSHGHVTSFSS
eukprot:CAMPEP_0116898960 /NCGR_PEP_ID=MMETSP0467-20121206/7606_1 /TAXON_ID=283647 /ORGANISM="Mesodinium pulex, Strain SPMC105" /LENGTH=117 /DNA_ID=CAMNT_0004571457 /DNA_START=162 /DNA_END=515 /DNA_ORIENTATION=-